MEEFENYKKKVRHTVSCAALSFSTIALALLLSTPISLAATLPEEIITEGTASISQLKRQFEESEKRMFREFNKLVPYETKKFRVFCDYVARAGTRITEHRCEPVYFKIAQEEEAQQVMKNLGMLAVQVTGPGRTTLKRDTQIMKEMLVEFIQTNSEFEEVVNDFESKKAKYLNRINN